MQLNLLVSSSWLKQIIPVVTDKISPNLEIFFGLCSCCLLNKTLEQTFVWQRVRLSEFSLKQNSMTSQIDSLCEKFSNLIKNSFFLFLTLHPSIFLIKYNLLAGYLVDSFNLKFPLHCLLTSTDSFVSGLSV